MKTRWATWFAGAASLLLMSGLLRPATALTLAPTQLRGIRGVNVIVNVTAPLGEEAEVLKKSVGARVDRLLSDAGLLLTTAEGQWFYFDVQAVPIDAAREGRYALLVSAKLRERVSLKRDPSILLADDGITWWKQCIKVVPHGELAKSVDETLDYYVGEFADHWRMENPVIKAGGTRQ